MLFESIAEFTAILPSHKRLMGLDVGDKTIGLSLSDIMLTIASPLLTIKRSKFSKDVETLKNLVAEHKICGLVIGYPMNMDGSHGPRTQSTRAFVSNLKKHIDLPMLMWDERLTTMAVQRAMLEGDLSRQKRAQLVDKLAASYMLQGFLDTIK